MSDPIEEYADLCVRIHNDFETFVRRSHKGYVIDKLHRDIIAALVQFEQDVVDRKSPRLAIMAPPRHGKTYLTAERFVAWFLGRHPHEPIISTSYSLDRAKESARHVRDLTREEWYKDAFPDFEIKGDANTSERWETTKNGGLKAVGVEGGTTGFGARILLIDDPLKDASESFSSTQRNKVWDWYQSTAGTRLAEGGGVIIIMTRWHKDDLIGRLLNRDNAKRWKVVKIPAIDSNGEPASPRLFSKESLELIKTERGDYWWSSLYQQEPVDLMDLPFRPEHIKRVPEVDVRGHVLKATMDLAYTVGTSNDYSALVIGGRDSIGTRRIIKAEERKVDPIQRDHWIISICRQWEPKGLKELYIEGVPDALVRTQELLKREGIKIKVYPLTTKGRSKTERILEIQGQLPATEFGPDTEQLIERMLTWSPASGTPDDLPDALAYLYEVMDKDYKPLSTIKEQPPTDPVRRRLWEAQKGIRR